MPGMIYTPVHYPYPWCEDIVLTVRTTGFHAPRLRDGGVHGAHRASPIFREAQALHLHIGESNNSEAAIWPEGESIILERQITLLTSET